MRVASTKNRADNHLLNSKCPISLQSNEGVVCGRKVRSYLFEPDYIWMP